MMGKVKGCINEACISNQKKITFKEVENYCSKCGDKLFYVCRECYTQLPDDADKYCERCIAKKQDRKDHAKENALKIGAAIAPLGIAVIGKGEKILKVIAKFK